jgi:hypothetical protein
MPECPAVRVESPLEMVWAVAGALHAGVLPFEAVVSRSACVPQKVVRGRWSVFPWSAAYGRKELPGPS